jgi:hypothetical protein
MKAKMSLQWLAQLPLSQINSRKLMEQARENECDA